MAQRESDVIDPFRATGGNTVPPGQYDKDLLTAAPRRGPSAGATSFAPGTAGDRSGAGTAVSGSGVGGARSAPQLSTVGRSSSGKSARTPWYLTTAGIAALVIGLLIALGLGVGLGVGLGTRDSGDSKADAANANADGGAASTVTSMSTLNSVITADPSTSYIPVIVTGNSASVATVVQTIGGSTVTLTAAGGGATSRPVITVSQAAPPTTRTEIVYATTYAETQTVTVTGNGGAVSTVTQVVTVQRTITAQAGAFGARRRQRLEAALFASFPN
ncbi:uncharacterized protein JCM10292_001509 [Rhodotorula paludigena]|uniref:uncharacterized protein n=1 Tax=Rhodotorula paludigena TaxID=86838 RepID=UPI00316DBEC7